MRTRVRREPSELEVLRLRKQIRRELMTVEGLRQGLDAVRERHAVVAAENVRLRAEIQSLRAESASRRAWPDLHRPSRAA